MEKLSNDEVAEVVSYEGIGYTVTCNMNSDSIADPELAKLWDDAQTALNDITNFLFPDGEEKWMEDHYGEDDIDE